MKVLADFHHSSLLRSLVLLFENRLGGSLFRPIGMEWFNEGYWAINKQQDTAKQFLGMEQAYVPPDGTPPLNHFRVNGERGVYYCADPGGYELNKACTLDFFANNEFDYVIASIPQHVEPYKRLIAKYNPKAKLIIQMGNNWNIKQYVGHNVLASISPQDTPGVNAMFYHQEFDLNIFNYKKIEITKKIYSFVNIIQNTGIGWQDYQDLDALLEKKRGWDFKAFGGQCPDGNMTGPRALAAKMHEAQFIFHVKPGGDGFGHIIHNAFATGRPLITRPSHYNGQLAEQLLVPGTFIDLDRYGPTEIKNIILQYTEDEDALVGMSKAVYNRFREVVNYEKEAEEIKRWLAAM